MIAITELRVWGLLSQLAIFKTENKVCNINFVNDLMKSLKPIGMNLYPLLILSVPSNLERTYNYLGCNLNNNKLFTVQNIEELNEVLNKALKKSDNTVCFLATNFPFPSQDRINVMMLPDNLTSIGFKTMDETWQTGQNILAQDIK